MTLQVRVNKDFLSNVHPIKCLTVTNVDNDKCLTVKQEQDGGRVRKAPFTLLDTVLNFTVYIFLEARIKSKYIGTSLDSTN